jgi:hypothetical protein
VPVLFNKIRDGKLKGGFTSQPFRAPRTPLKNRNPSLIEWVEIDILLVDFVLFMQHAPDLPS